ncbi:hypothetical protein CDD81_4630 [Ophiocordyceps australis]|uniref:Calcineurin-like phosphoesterase domain-containing protein n=1 Tax=Ophiocordyceps australis TaxID=1399860 RepID=A0A2C5XAD6_9HYPO|nr:hypothetical protein CDD81_4630 [Ophiocordyceps australis]
MRVVEALLALGVFGVLSSCLPQGLSDDYGENVTQHLRFKSDGTFEITVFEDLHFGENAWESWGPQQDINTVKVMESVLEHESPDVVVFNGDLITGENAFAANSTVYIEQMVAPLVKRGLRWASTYGNHDYDYNISGEQILKRERQWRNSLTQSMVPGRKAGVSNYYLAVFPPDCEHGEQCGQAPELILWFFDSRGGFYRGELDANGNRVGQPGWVDTRAVEWFQATNARLRASFGRTIPSLAFVHIPTNASLALQEQRGVDSHRQPGINLDRPLAQQALGWCADGTNAPGCYYGGQDVPFMQALTTTPGLVALFSGHDHGDSWCYRWDGLVPGMTVAGNGLNLCFGQHSGYGGYGDWIRGARHISVSRQTLKHSWEAKTWIRLESGDVVGAVSLNASYGRDVYPETPDSRTHCPTCIYPAREAAFRAKQTRAQSRIKVPGEYRHPSL